MKELNEIKALIDTAKAGQLLARNELADRLEALGYSRYSSRNFPHPTEEGKKVCLDIQDCYKHGNEFLGYFYINVMWTTPHQHDDDCRNCDEEVDIHRREATIEEVLSALRLDLLMCLQQEEIELQRDWEMAKALPTEEELTKMRRREEDHLRKNPKDIPAVAKLLKIL